ncbi:uncharacterized protein LOC128231845 [Mya arenaria]|uniref:uncharacterized protein LOC128231845 n=1 Tax=Mya arenaria TaxID=6604 RepID=UPI0022E39320|nr:uncharacterized protein LOC128231845 [Mya arenaria]
MLQHTDNGHALSNAIFQVMDHLGYSLEMVQKRRAMYREIDAAANLNDESFRRITAGSKAEGIARPYESDYDRLYEDKHVECFISESGITSSIGSDVTVFEMSGEHCYPGHFKLKLTQEGPQMNHCIRKALVSTPDGNSFISSEMFTSAFKASKDSCSTYKEWSGHPKTGPSIPRSKGLNQEDRVYSFRCISQKKILESWMKRERKHWPPPALCAQVFQEVAHLVPTGCKGTEHFDMEWRICFMGELSLTCSLTEVQYKLYILLKMLKKTFLSPVCDGVSSFVMKNTVYWMCEEYPSEFFTPDNLLDAVIIALSKVKKALNDGNFPYFMIPERNLLFNKVTQEQRLQMCSILDTLIADGPRCVLKCEKISQSETLSTKALAENGTRRDRIELLKLATMKERTIVYKSGMTEKEILKLAWGREEFQHAQLDLYDILFPGWRDTLVTDMLSDEVDLRRFSPEEIGHIEVVGRIFFESEWPHVVQFLNLKEHNVTEDMFKEETVVKVSGKYSLLGAREMR